MSKWPYLYAQERKLRAYSRDGSPAHVTAVTQAFEMWVKRTWNDTVVTSTPLRAPQTNVKPAAALSSALDMPREHLLESAVQLKADGGGLKKRKIQLDPIPE